jgi:hypothetical protein
MMSRISRVVTFGCSITFGCGLQHDEFDKVYGKILSDCLNLEFRNMAQSGCSNNDIYHQVKLYLENDARPDDLVLLALTGLSRNNLYHTPEIIDDDYFKINRAMESVVFINNLLSEQQIPFVFMEAFLNYKTYMTFPPEVEQNFLFWSDSETSLYDILCDSFGSNVEENMLDHIIDYDHLHITTKDTTLFLPCSHPTVEGHRKIAEYILPHIVDRFDLEPA